MIETITSETYWFGLTTGALIAKTATRAIKYKFEQSVGVQTDDNDN